jgi:hypothetical protein
MIFPKKRPIGLQSRVVDLERMSGMVLSARGPCPPKISCLICRKEIKISTASPNLQGHIEQTMHILYPTKAATREIALTYYQKRSIIKQAPFLGSSSLDD